MWPVKLGLATVEWEAEWEGFLGLLLFDDSTGVCLPLHRCPLLIHWNWSPDICTFYFHPISQRIFWSQHYDREIHYYSVHSQYDTVSVQKNCKTGCNQWDWKRCNPRIYRNIWHHLLMLMLRSRGTTSVYCVSPKYICQYYVLSEVNMYTHVLLLRFCGLSS